MFSFTKSLTKSQRTLVWACFYAYFVSGLLALTQGSMMPDLKAANGLTDTFSGMLLSAHSIGNLAAGFLSGAVGAYLGRKRTVVALSALAFVGMALIALCGAKGVLFLAFILTGMGRGGVTNFNNATVNAVTDGNAAALNLLHCTFSVGAIAAPMLFLAFRSLISWRAALMLVVACGAVSVLNLSRTTVENDRPAKQAGGTGGFGFMRDARFVTLALMMLFYLCSEYSINGWLVTYLQSRAGLADALGGADAVRAYSQTMATLLWAVILVGRLCCAWLSQRVSVRALMLGCAACEALSFAGMLFSGSIAAVTLFVGLTGFCMSGICPMIYADAAPYTNKYPMATGMLLALGSLGGIIMPTVVDALADRFGFSGGMAAILAAIILLVICSAANVTMKEK
ncbi:MAG: MFS transporter [Clostridia bacterium]|nr:MFS transporter [Clostridia bacterium]